MGNDQFLNLKNPATATDVLSVTRRGNRVGSWQVADILREEKTYASNQEGHVKVPPDFEGSRGKIKTFFADMHDVDHQCPCDETYKSKYRESGHVMSPPRLLRCQRAVVRGNPEHDKRVGDVPHGTEQRVVVEGELSITLNLD